MHSSRMHTGHALTISGGGGASQQDFFWGEKEIGKKRNWKKKEKKNFRPPRKFGADTPPKIWSRHPPKNSRPPLRKFGADTPPENSRPPPKIWSRHSPPLLTESQTRVKILPWPNFVAAGNKHERVLYC